MPFDVTKGAPQRIAVIGGGISGLSAAWLLAPHHQVTLFEAEPRLGGHARTVMAGRNGDQPVDTGFIVFNHVTYPYLTGLFRDLDVPIVKSDMSFGVSLDNGRVEYALRSLNSLFGQRRNLVVSGFYSMIRDILRFNAEAERVLGYAPSASIAELLMIMGLGARFRDHYLFPFCAAIWSTPESDIGAFPARPLIRFMRNHGLMSHKGHYQWWTVEGGSISYVSRLTEALVRLNVDLRPGAPVKAVSRQEGSITVRPYGGQDESFDHVIFACHSDQALMMLSDADTEERANLSAIRFQPNRAVLHADTRVMPRRRTCWSSWVSHNQTGSGVGVSYWMNKLQNIPEDDPLFVSLNPGQEIDERLIYDEKTFDHPLFDQAAIVAQERIAARQGHRNTWFAGAWLRNGFHEDGFATAMRVARHLTPAQVIL
ncbi:NAD(P)/FAD-dependent oxidoreductase [Celeribacter persicus]|uniref:Putative NAD/FAD-binding protein n=1 Tax=Celeribacter persicus TaxID=1651082 RepID=A0A2T5HW75_9RHOB|nr:FAD-dependent oxidoreductase [Celeribacter persicus]PTQ75857.1 putative NAD/FAD-binding protein [Celeribacter persicus]